MSDELNVGDLLPVFLTEADEQIAVLDTSLLDLEKEDQSEELVREIFRAAHTLKGSSAAMGFTHLADLTHAMENVFDAIRQHSLTVTDEVVDRLLEALDRIKEMRNAIDTHSTDSIETPVANLAASLQRLAAGDASALGAAPAASAEPAQPAPVEAASTWQLTVNFTAECEMPAVRCFMVLRALSGLGNVIASDPTMSAIQDGNVGRELRVWMHSDSTPEALQKEVQAVSEVSTVTVSASAVVPKPVAAPAETDAPQQSVSPEVGAAPQPGPSPENSAAPQQAPAAEDDTAPKPAPAGSETPAGQTKRSGTTHASTQTVRVSVERLDKLMNLVGELVIDRTRITRIGLIEGEERNDDAAKDLLETSLHLGRVIGEVQDEIMKARMLPIEQVFMRFPRMVRDLSHKAGKMIDFQVEGGETELDRSVIESIVDPLTHLLRNAVDHGIEPPEERVRKGKSQTGRVTIRAHHEENQIVVVVEDDGGGIDVERVRDKAVNAGLISSSDAAAMTERESLQLIFLAGLSTSEKVTDISGRGVGMDIVHNNIQRLGGSVDVETTPGSGTRFTVRLPLTLAIIRGLLVDHAGDTYIIPLSSVAETLRITTEEIQRINGRDTLLHRGSVLPLVTLDQVFDIQRPREARSHLFMVVARYGQTHLGIVVDRLIGEQEIVIKPLDALIGESRGLAGASILGNGQVALILDIPAFAAEAGVNQRSRSRALAA